MQIFVTGAESFVGRELRKQCVAEGIDVIGMDLVPGDSKQSLVGDIRDINIADKIPEEVDAIVHLAALSRDSDCSNNAYSCFDINVIGTLNLIGAAGKRGIQQFIFASTEWVYDSFEPGEIKTEESPVDITNLTSEYALSKLVSECNLRQKHRQGFPGVTILRFGIIYGPRLKNWSAVESIFHAVATQDTVTVGNLNTGRHFIHVSDIAKAIIKSIGLRGFEILNIQGDRLITLGDIIETTKRILNKNPKVMESAPDKPSVHRVSNKKAKEMLNWQPTINLESGLRSIKVF